MDIKDTLAERQQTHGDFGTTAVASQALMSELRTMPNWCKLTDVEREGLEMIMHKVARIMCGNPHYADSWHDVAGYATLVEREQLNDNA